MKIAHTADIHIRFASRNVEYRQVFERFYEDLRKEKPDRIVIVGDLNHQKINMSPDSLDLSSELLINLSKISAVDVFLGNHDINLQQLEQKDSISPIFNLINLVQEDGKRTAHIVSESNKDTIDFSKKCIYFYPDSGFYKIAKDLVYGVYSCKDNKILALETKELGVNYLAFFHGQIYDCVGDNGYKIKGDNLLKITAFNNFDAVLLGDIHQYQSFRDDETAKFPGSLIQQNYGEEIDKGYLLWDINTKKITSVRKYIPNEFGFAKITIAKGEKFEERIEHIQFSANKKKTKVYIVWEDYEENFSQEKENQIIKLVKDRHGCEIVKVQFETIIKDVIVTEGEEEIFKESEEYLREFIEDGSFDCTNEELKDLVALHRETNTILEIVEGENTNSEWKLNKVEISNIFSFPVKATTIDFDSHQGITGIFGENYNGKSNVIKSMVWGLYKEILGGGDPRFVVNIYTDSNKGYVKFWITIDGQKYYIERSVKTTKKKDGSTSNSYSILYKKLEFEYDEEGNLDSEKWENEKSDEKAAEKNEVCKLIENAIGTFDDFTKTSLQTQGGKDDYLNMSQQPKNSLVSKYLGLESYKFRYEFRKEYFNEIKKKQKELGDKLQIEEDIKEMVLNKNIKTKEYDNAVLEKEKANNSREKTDGDILGLTKKLEKIESVNISDPVKVMDLIKQHEVEAGGLGKDIVQLESWISTNFKKELPFDGSVTIEQLNSSLIKEREGANKEKEEFLNIKEWLENNSLKKELALSENIEADIDSLKLKISQLEGLSDTFKGKKCKTCGSVHEKPNPQKEEECTEEIKINKELLQYKQTTIKENNEIVSHNLKYQNSLSKYELLKQSLINRKDKIESLKSKIDLINNSQDIIKHNQLVESNSLALSRTKNKVDGLVKSIEVLTNDLVKIKNNENKIKNNLTIQEQIDTLTELSRAYKLSVYNADKQVTRLFGDIKVIESNIENHSKKLIDIREYEQLYKKFSIYLQAMHKDGIPALIIRKKIPLLNHRINTILQQAVNFKINMDILANGDIVETFYFSEDKSDTLPLSFASGAQKFVSSIAIKDALHYISSLPKPSLCIIDEGFGTLDDKLTFEITNILTYLKNKHKNVIVITHRSEIKDFADNIIEVLKVKQGLTQEVIDANPEAGVTKLNII